MGEMVLKSEKWPIRAGDQEQGNREPGTWNLGGGTGEDDRGGWHWGAECWGCASEIPHN